MKKKLYSELSNEALLKRRDLFKGILIGFSIIYVIVIAIFIYLFAVKGFKNFSVAAIMPVFFLPVVFMPLMINWNLLSTEIKARNL